MSVKNEKFTISTKGFDDVIDITKKIQDIVSGFNIEAGLANVSICSSGASLLTLESEPGLALDLPKLLENIVPINKVYQHDNLWHDGNANAHLKASLLGNSINIPIIEGKINLDTWQKIVIIDFDNKPRNREIVVSIVF